jgi:hypothetical protein
MSDRPLLLILKIANFNFLASNLKLRQSPHMEKSGLVSIYTLGQRMLTIKYRYLRISLAINPTTQFPIQKLSRN